MRRWFFLLLVSMLAFALVGHVTAQASQTEDLVATYERYLEVWNTGEFDILEEVLLPDFVRHSQWESDNYGIEEVAAVITGFRETFGPETHHAVAEATVKGDRVWMTGAVTPPGQDTMAYTALVRFEDGMMAEMWAADNPMLVLELLETTQTTNTQTTEALASMGGADSASVIIDIYEAVNNGDVDGAMDLVAEGAMLTTMMGGAPSVRIDKATIRAWFEYLVGDNFHAEFSDATVHGNRATVMLTSTGNYPESLGFDFNFEGIGVTHDGLLKSLTWIATPETLANLAAADARAADEAAITFQTSLLAELPADATVVEAFSAQKIMCEGLSEWSVNASPEDWTHVHAKWMTTTEDLLVESWPLVDIRISVDGQEIADVARFVNGPVPLEVVCGEDVTAGAAMEIDFFVPPMPEGEHTVTWEYVIKEAHNDGWDDIPAGQYGLFTANLGVNHNAEMIDMVKARDEAMNAGNAKLASSYYADDATYTVIFGPDQAPLVLTGKQAIFDRLASFVPGNVHYETNVLGVVDNTLRSFGTWAFDPLRDDGIDHLESFEEFVFESGKIVSHTMTTTDVVPLETPMTEHIVHDVQELVGRWQTSLMSGLAHMNVDADGSVEITYPVAGIDASWVKGELWFEGSTLNVQWLGEQDPVTYEVHIQMIGEDPVHLSLFDIYDPVPERVGAFSAGMNFAER